MTKQEIAETYVKNWQSRAKGYQEAKVAETRGSAPIDVKLLPIIALCLNEKYCAGDYGTDASVDQRKAFKTVLDAMCDDAQDAVLALIRTKDEYIREYTEAEA